MRVWWLLCGLPRKPTVPCSFLQLHLAHSSNATIPSSAHVLPCEARNFVAVPCSVVALRAGARPRNTVSQRGRMEHCTLALGACAGIAHPPVFPRFPSPCSSCLSVRVRRAPVEAVASGFFLLALTFRAGEGAGCVGQPNGGRGEETPMLSGCAFVCVWRFASFLLGIVAAGNQRKGLGNQTSNKAALPALPCPRSP
jgi:hypothetical protein